MDSLFPYLILDLVVVALVILVMFWRMTFWHPLTAYLFFHLYSFTYRLAKLVGGAVPPLYTAIPNAEVITSEELSRAMIWADVGLVAFVFASWLAHLEFDARVHAPVRRNVFNPNIAKFLGVACLPVGAYFFFAFKRGLLEVEVGSAGAGYMQSIALWPIGVLCMLVFAFGFRWYLVALIGLFLSNIALQGYHRFMLVLPLFFLTAYYLQSHRRRWPSLVLLGAAIFFGLIFPRLKNIGQAVQNGDSGEAWAQVAQSFSFSSKDQDLAASEDFLDQYAGALSLADASGRKLWGSTYLAIVTLPIPRAWWPNKPGLADHLQEISTSGRNYAVEGRIITYLGESYLNFGYLGFFLIPALMGYLLTAYCLHTTTGPVQRLARYVYLVVFIALVQTFRDGLLSIFVFTIVHNMPMLFALILHMVPGFAAKSLDRPAADPLAGEEEEEVRAEEARRLGGPEGQRNR